MTNHFLYLAERIFLGMMLSALQLTAQDTDLFVRYTPGFRFRDGVYVSMHQIRTNSPVPKEYLLIADHYNDISFFRKILSVHQLEYTSRDGSKGVIEREKVLGFSAGGALNLMHKGRFSSEVLVGSISFFRIDKSLSFPTYYSLADTGILPWVTPFYFGPRQDELIIRTTYGQSDCFLMDFERGMKYRFKPVNLARLIKKDMELHGQFISLGRKAKKAGMFYFIGKFNEKNPLYLPLK